MRAMLRAMARGYPYVAGGLAPVFAWFAGSLFWLRFAVTAWALSYALLFASWRSAARKARRCEIAHSQRLQCAACRHYSCDGELCGTCEGPCTTPRGTRPARLRVPRPRPHAYWLN